MGSRTLASQGGSFSLHLIRDYEVIQGMYRRLGLSGISGFRFSTCTSTASTTATPAKKYHYWPTSTTETQQYAVDLDFHPA